MSMEQRYAGFIERESHNASTPTKGEAMRQAARLLLENARENERMRKEIYALQEALSFWLPCVPGVHSERDVAAYVPTEQAASLVQTARAIDREADTCETLTLGAINALLSPIRIDAAGLAELGFEPSATVKSAKHYPAGDFARICHAISNRAMAAAHAAHRAQVEAMT